ncbi:J domain-containing protein [Bacteroidota bacterium]
MPGTKDYYKILGIEHDATPDEIKRAYRAMAKIYHPDINKSPDAHDRFVEITEAYEILMNRDLHAYYVHRYRTDDKEFMRAQYERAREAAQEAARRYARMKFEKFKQEQEAFKKSGWHDLLLTLRYILRILVFPLAGLFIVLPIISDEVSEHPTGYVMFWLFATILIFFVINNWKNYLRIDSYYYHLSDLWKFFRETSKKTENDCYYCPGHKAMVFPYKVSLFRIKKIQMQNFGALYGRRAGISRDLKTIPVPRSRKAFIMHSAASLIKVSVFLACMIFITMSPISRLSLPVGLILGGLFSRIFLLLVSTKPKTSYLVSLGMLIKILVWIVLIWFFQSYAYIYLFFDPMFEALLRLLSGDRLFIPIMKEYPPLRKLFCKQYQLYMELPVLSVISPLFKWLF